MIGSPLLSFMSNCLPENVTNIGSYESKQTAERESDIDVSANVAVFDHDSSLTAAGSSGKAQSEHVSRRSTVQMKTGCSDDSQQLKYQRSIEFLRSQHQELVGNLHEEIERLKRKNRGFVLRHFSFAMCYFYCMPPILLCAINK